MLNFLSGDFLNPAIAKFNALSDRFEDDEPILGFKQINDTLDDAESKYTSLITGVVASQVDRWWKAIAPALDTLDEKQIEKHPLSLTTGIQGVLLSGWREIFSTGSKDGIAEVNEIGLAEKEKSPRGLFNDCHSLLVEFSDYRRRVTPSFHGLGDSDFSSDRLDNVARFLGESLVWAEPKTALTRFASIDRSGIDKYIKRKPAFEVAYPPDQADLDVLDVDELRSALNLRTQVLAEDLSQEVNDKIARVIKDSVDLHFVQGKEVQRLPLAARTKIRNKINGIIGYERQKQKERGVAERDLPRTVIEIPGKVDAQGNAVVVRRAKMIASTELNAGYNLGRLQSYYRAGVTSVRWQAIGDSRTCEICTSRNGTTLPLEQVLKSGIAQAKSGSRKAKYSDWEYIIPAHPFCRCAWQVATQEESKDKLRGVANVVPPKPLAKSWNVVGSAVNLATGVGTATGILNTAQKITREKQLQEKARQKAKNRATTAAAGVLGLGLLSLGLWSWLNRTKKVSPLASVQELTPSSLVVEKVGDALTAIASEEAQSKAIASALVKSQGELAAARQKREIELTRLPLTPEILMRGRNLEQLGWNKTRQQRYAAFIASGVDLKTISDTELKTRFALLPQDISLVRGLARQYQKDLVKTSPYQKLLPAAVVSPLWLAKYPWLADVSDLRDLNIRQMLKKGIPEPDALQIYNRVYQQTRAAAGISRVSKEERSLLQKINSITTKEELAGLLQLTRNQNTIVNSLFAKLQRYKAQGKEIKSLAELRLRGIGDQTIARMLAEAKGKLRINEVLMSSDRDLGLARLKTIAGVGDKTAEAIYEALLDTGVQFLDADDMIRRIEPYVRARGVAISPRVKKAISNRLDFTYYPGLDRQALPPANDFPTLPGFERRGDNPGNPTTSQPSGQLPPRNGRRNQQQPILVGTPSPNLLPASQEADGRGLVQEATWDGARTSMAINEVFASSINLKKTLATEIKQIKPNPLSRETLGNQLIKAEQKASRILQKNIDEVRSEQRLQASALVENIDSAISNLANDLEQAIVNPLASDGYSPQGRLSWDYRNRVNQNIRQIELTISKIDAGQNLSRQEQSQLKRLNKELTRLKRQAFAAGEEIKKNPASTSNLEQEKALRRSQELLEQLENLPPEVVSDDYPLATNIDLVKITQQELKAMENPVVRQIDELLEQLDLKEKSSGKVVNPEDRSLQNRLIEQKNKLIEIRDRKLSDQQLKINQETINQRKAIANQSRRAAKQLKQFEQDYSVLEQEVAVNSVETAKYIKMADPQALAVNQKLSIEQAQIQIDKRIRIIDSNQRDLDLLKSDRWQQYATSVANLEDMAKGGTLSNNYLSFEELVAKRNEKLNQAAGEIKRNAQEISAWAENPRNILKQMLQSTEETLAKLKATQDKQNQLEVQAQKLLELGNNAIANKSTRYQNQISNEIAQVEQAKANLQKAIAADYKLNLGEDNKPRSREKVKDLAVKAVDRSKQRLVLKDRATVTSILDKVDRAGLNTTDLIAAAKSRTYSAEQQVLIDSLSPAEKKSLNRAIDKQVLELNQDLRVMENSRDFLNSMKNSLNQKNQQLKAEVVKNFYPKGSKQVKLLTELTSALDKNDTIKAIAIASRLPSPLAQKAVAKIEQIAENLGLPEKVSQTEVNILAGVRPDKISRQEFINLVKGNPANAQLYNLAEIEQAIALNEVGLKRASDRLSAVNFAEELALQEF